MTDMDSAESPRLELSNRQRTEILQAILENECTGCQRSTFVDYHFLGKTMPQIARERGVHISTVSRDLKRAEKKVKRFTKYVQIGVNFLIQNFNNMEDQV